MFLVIFQTLLDIAAGAAMFFLWRKTLSRDRWSNLLIAGGFLLRAFTGQALFWISYARLPIARSLQMGNGFWFFALDAANLYYPQAVTYAHAGVASIVHYPRGLSSVAFVQTLSTAVLVFGESPAVGLLLNLFCFLASAYLIVRWAAHSERSVIAARIALAAIALSPAFIIWSLQPLKDTTFQFLVLAFIAGCAAWQRASVSGSPAWKRVAIVSGMCITLYMLAGIRWYFVLVMFAAASGFALLVALTSRQHRAIELVSAIGVIFVLSRAFLFGAGPYVPDPVRGILTGSTRASAVTSLPSGMGQEVESARNAFEVAGGATQIGLGGKLAHAAPDISRPNMPETQPAVTPSSATQSAVIQPAVTQSAASQPAASQPASTPQVAETQSSADSRTAASTTDDDRTMTTLPVVTKRPGIDLHPQVTQTHPQVTQTAAAPASSAAPVPPQDQKNTATAPPIPHSRPIQTQSSQQITATAAPAPAVAPSTTQGAEKQAATPSAPPANNPASADSLPPTNASSTRAVTSATHKKNPVSAHPSRPVPMKATGVAAEPPTVTTPAPVQTVAVEKSPTASHDVAEKRETPVTLPSSKIARLAAGAAALLIPRSIGEALGMFHIGGGRNLWWVTDIDTLIFDIVLFAAVFWTVRSLRSASLRNPVFWLVTLLTVMIGVPLMYVVTNFGTLFRMREMIYLGLMLIPLALVSAPAGIARNGAADPASSDAQAQ